MAYDYPIREIKKGVEVCLGTLSRSDSFLLESGASEMSISHKLAEYLQAHFPDWDVDCEYNRKGLEPKVLQGIHECSDKKSTDRVFPDIIIHRRNSNDNLLVIEVKNGSDDPCDLKKLELFTSPDGNFKYKLGLFIRLDGTKKSSLRWFNDGKEDWK